MIIRNRIENYVANNKSYNGNIRLFTENNMILNKKFNFS